MQHLAAVKMNISFTTDNSWVVAMSVLSTLFSVRYSSAIYNGVPDRVEMIHAPEMPWHLSHAWSTDPSMFVAQDFLIHKLYRTRQRITVVKDQIRQWLTGPFTVVLNIYVSIPNRFSD